jgi:hypothetical protein
MAAVERRESLYVRTKGGPEIGYFNGCLHPTVTPHNQSFAQALSEKNGAGALHHLVALRPPLAWSAARMLFSQRSTRRIHVPA